MHEVKLKIIDESKTMIRMIEGLWFKKFSHLMFLSFIFCLFKVVKFNLSSFATKGSQRVRIGVAAEFENRLPVLLLL
jgi:hypothetical protein